MAEANDSKSFKYGFESHVRYHFNSFFGQPYLVKDSILLVYPNWQRDLAQIQDSVGSNPTTSTRTYGIIQI